MFAAVAGGRARFSYFLNNEACLRQWINIIRECPGENRYGELGDLFADFLRRIGVILVVFDHGAADLPVEVFNLRLVGQIQHAEREHVLRVFAAFERIVVGFEFVQLGKILFDVEQLPDERMLAVDR